MVGSSSAWSPVDGWLHANSLRREVLALWLQERFKFMELFYGIANRLDELMDQNQRKGQ